MAAAEAAAGGAKLRLRRPPAATFLARTRQEIAELHTALPVRGVRLVQQAHLAAAVALGAKAGLTLPENVRR